MATTSLQQTMKAMAPQQQTAVMALQQRMAA